VSITFLVSFQCKQPFEICPAKHPQFQLQVATIQTVAPISSHLFASNGPLHSSDGPPIIIVPNAANTLLNIYNAKDFLENGNYVKWDEKASLSSLKPTNVGVMRNINRKEPYPHYQILNVAPKAGSKDW
jgi:hypothetical protein